MHDTSDRIPYSPSEWDRLAEEARAKAERTPDRGAKKTFFAIAAAYAAMARHIGKEAARLKENSENSDRESGNTDRALKEP